MLTTTNVINKICYCQVPAVILEKSDTTMSFEDDIKQSKKISEHQKGVANLVLTYNEVIGKLEAFLEKYDLTLPQFNILRILRGQYPSPSTNNLIKERIIHRNSDVTRIIDRMITKGLVERSGCCDDRRKVDIIISQEGLRILEEIDSNIDIMEAILSGLEPKEIVEFNRLLDKIRTVL
jgi:DNA-binding MarR family transcriptional regulator